MVPDDWKIADFKDLNISTIDGDRGKNYPKKEGYLDHGYCLFLGADNVINGVLSLEKSIYISKENHEVLRKGVIQNDDILLVMRGNGTGRSCIFNDDKTKSIVNRINSGLAIIRADKTNVDVRYLHQLLQSSVVQKQFESFMFGSAQPQLTIQILKTIILPAPKLKEQKIIASILSTWDKAIETTEKLIENSKAQKKALMQQLLTGKRRFSGFKEKWGWVKLSTLCRVRRGASPRPIKDDKWFSKEGRGWVRISDVTATKTQYLTSTTQYLSDLGVENSISVDPGDLIMSICGTIGVPKFLGIPACIHDGFVVFREPVKYLSLNFLYHYLSYVSGQLASGGQPGTQKNLNTSIVGNTLIPRISTKEQDVIALSLGLADQETWNLEWQCELLERQKKALMQQLLTGKRRVKLDNTKTTKSVA